MQHRAPTDAFQTRANVGAVEHPELPTHTVEHGTATARSAKLDAVRAEVFSHYAEGDGPTCNWDDIGSEPAPDGAPGPLAFPEYAPEEPEVEGKKGEEGESWLESLFGAGHTAMEFFETIKHMSIGPMPLVFPKMPPLFPGEGSDESA